MIDEMEQQIEQLGRQIQRFGAPEHPVGGAIDQERTEPA
jgi:hypothetical protein